MKKHFTLKKILLGCCLLTIPLLAGISCSPEKDDINLYVPKDVVELNTADTGITIVPGKMSLSITSLKTEDGREMIENPVAYDFCEEVNIDNAHVFPDWEFVGVREWESDDEPAATKTVSFLYKDYGNKIRLYLDVISRPDLAGPFEFVSRIYNESGDTVKIIPASFASFNAKAEGEIVSVKKESGSAEGFRQINGVYFGGTGIYRTAANSDTNVKAWVTTYQSFNESGYFPFLYQDMGDCGLYCGLEWSSGRVIARGSEDGIKYSVDMDNISAPGGEFITKLKNKDTLILPSVYIGAYDGTLDQGSNVFKRWFFDCKVPDKLRDDTNEPLSQTDMQTGLTSYGVESIKWDYGWWTNETLGNWKTLEGSWQIRSDAYKGVLAGYGCTTMAEFGAMAREQGLNWTTYVLLHDTLDGDGNPTEEFGEFNSKTHPEWFSNRKIDVGMGNSADLGNEECTEYLKKAMADYFNENNVGTWRSDFEPICYWSDKENRHSANGSDVMYWCSVGFRDLVTYLYDNVENFRYESCSSGGSMKDLFTATLAVSINTDDLANYLSMRATFYDSSYIINPAQLQFPCNSDQFNTTLPDKMWPKISTSCKDKDAIEKAMKDMGYRSQCLGSPMFSSHTCTINSEYYEKYSEMYASKMRPLIRDGELYHILPRPDGVNYDGVMYADPDSANAIKGLVYLFKPSETPGNTCHLTLAGLNPEVTYQLTFEDRPEQNFTATGESLMTAGFDAEILYVGSELIWITEC